jgi:hypothetical protein
MNDFGSQYNAALMKYLRGGILLLNRLLCSPCVRKLIDQPDMLDRRLRVKTEETLEG